MDLTILSKRYWGLLFDTRREWQRINFDSSNFFWHFRTFVLPLAVLLFVLAFVRYLNSGIWVATAQGFVQPAITLTVIFTGAYILEKLSGNFTPGNRRQFRLILNYASIPIFVTQILSLITGYFGILSIVSLLIVWFGIKVLINPIDEKKLGFFLLSGLMLLFTQLVSTVVFYAILGLNYK